MHVAFFFFSKARQKSRPLLSGLGFGIRPVQYAVAWWRVSHYLYDDGIGPLSSPDGVPWVGTDGPFQNLIAGKDARNGAFALRLLRVRVKVAFPLARIVGSWPRKRWWVHFQDIQVGLGCCCLAGPVTSLAVVVTHLRHLLAFFSPLVLLSLTIPAGIALGAP